VTSPPLAFRAMGEADLPRILEIERAGFLHPWSEQLLRNELQQAWSHPLVAVERGAAGERVVGYLVWWLVHDEVHVLNVGTAPEARRRGVGRALMEEAARRGRLKGARLATLEVRRSNAAALALYRALGYQQVGVRPRYYAEENEDAIVMTLQLDPR
jgi:[ribosomal protein S18]-alanine N-acetyltransferase